MISTAESAARVHETQRVILSAIRFEANNEIALAAASEGTSNICNVVSRDASTVTSPESASSTRLPSTPIIGNAVGLPELDTPAGTYVGTPKIDPPLLPI